jgi:hypothetical protein
MPGGFRMSTVQQPDDSDKIERWRRRLTLAALAGLIIAIILEIIALFVQQKTNVAITGKSPDTTTITTVGAGPPPSALVGGLFGGGAVLLLVAALFTRITKIVLPGGAELDIDTGAQLAAAIAPKTNEPQEAAKLFREAAPQAMREVAGRTSSSVSKPSETFASSGSSISFAEAEDLISSVSQQESKLT